MRYDIGLPDKLLKKLSRKNRLDEYENYVLYEVAYKDGSVGNFVCRSLPDLSNLSSGEDGKILPQYITIGAEPFKSLLRIDLVKSISPASVSKKK